MGLLLKEKNMFLTTDFCDCTDHIKLSGILNIFQDMASLHVNELNLGFDDIKEKGYLWVVMYQRIDIIEYPKSYTDCICRTWQKKKNRLEYEREYEICDLNNKPLIHGISNWVIVDSVKRCISKANDIEFIGEYYDYTYYPVKQKRKLNLKCDNPILNYKHTVKYSDLDHNMHMNNAKYLDIITDMNVHNGFKKINTAEMAYVKEAKEGEEINVLYYLDENNNDCYIFKIKDETIFELRITLEG